MQTLPPQPPPANPVSRPRRKKSRFRRLIKWLLLGAIVFFIIYNFKVTASNDSDEGFFQQFRYLITSKDRQVNGEAEDRINILLLGTGGEGHEGPNLTDTIMLMSFRPSDNKVSMLSIPRDLLVDFPGWGFRKINHVYALSEAKDPGTGGAQATQVVKKLFDIPIHYYVRVDFNGFVELIDAIGGVTVNVENTLEDPYYPVLGQETATTSERYEHLIIEKGIRHMNGETALKFVRSRKALGVEGSDFARSLRQQKVILGVKEKVLSFGTLFNPSRIIRIIKTLKNNFDTDLDSWEIARLYNLAKEVGSESVTTYVLDDSPNSPLKVYSAPDAYFLTTKTGDNSELAYIAQNIFDENLQITTAVTAQEAQKETTAEKQFKNSLLYIEVHNGTKIAGLAGRVAEFLTSENYQVINIKNAPVQTYKKTLLYDLTTEIGQSVLDAINEPFDAIIFQSGPPGPVRDQEGVEREYKVDGAADILLILGEDMQGKF